MTPTSRSIRPSRRPGPASNSSALNRRETPGASCRASRSSPGASAATTRSAVCSVKVLRRVSGSTREPGPSSAPRRCTTAAASSRRAWARGVGTMAWPARTRRGSWRVRRRRARVRLMAAGDVCSLAAARVTLCSVSRASRATASWASMTGSWLLMGIIPLQAIIAC
ncbi:hypothetical protein SALBM135S_01442 [Streptomyces alboniger]